jgi:hypothetical protein
VIAFAAPALATHPEQDPAAGAPQASEDARYCLRVEITGSRVDKVLCWTRAEWVDQEVDVDREWAENGVRVIG